MTGPSRAIDAMRECLDLARQGLLDAIEATAGNLAHPAVVDAARRYQGAARDLLPYESPKLSATFAEIVERERRAAAEDLRELTEDELRTLVVEGRAKEAAARVQRQLAADAGDEAAAAEIAADERSERLAALIRAEVERLREAERGKALVVKIERFFHDTPDPLPARPAAALPRPPVLEALPPPEEPAAPVVAVRPSQPRLDTPRGAPTAGSSAPGAVTSCPRSTAPMPARPTCRGRCTASPRVRAVEVQHDHHHLHPA